MRDYLLHVASEHKTTVVLMMGSFGASVAAFIDAIPDSVIAKIGLMAPIVTCIFVGLHTRYKAMREAAEARKVNAETIKQEIENEMLKIELEMKQREAYQRRRKEDKDNVE